MPAIIAAVWPKLRRKLDHLDARVARGERVELALGAVGAAVVHEHHLERLAERLERRHQALVERLTLRSSL